MCKCGCNTCETKTKGPLLTEGKVKSLLSEGLQYHIDKKIPLFETVYRIGSDKHLALIKEARKMYSRNVIDLCEDDEALIKTHLGEFGLYEGVSVPLDLPMLEESKMPTQDQVDKFFALTNNEMHYLNSKPVEGQEKTFNNTAVEPWDEYDLSNFNSLVRKAKSKGQVSENISSKEELILIQIKDLLKDMLKGDKDREEELEDLDLSIDAVTSAITGKSPFSIDLDQNVYGRLAPATANKNPKESLSENEDKLLKIKQELEALRPGTISWIDDIFISSYDGSLQVELDYTLYPNEIKQLAQIATKYGMELKYMTGKNATLVKNKINEDINQLKNLSNRKERYNYIKNFSKEKLIDIADELYLDYEEYDDIEDKILNSFGESLNEATRKDLGMVTSVSKRRAKAELKNPGNDGSKVYGLDKDGKRVHIKSIKDINKFFDFELDADIKEDKKPTLQEIIKKVLDEKKKAKKKEKKDPPLNKPKRGGSKAYYVYVRDPKTKKIKKVSFGSGGLRAKIRNAKARKAFAARHNCKNKKDRTKAGYWSCNLPRYAEALGLGAKMNTFW